MKVAIVERPGVRLACFLSRERYRENDIGGIASVWGGTIATAAAAVRRGKCRIVPLRSAATMPPAS